MCLKARRLAGKIAPCPNCGRQPFDVERLVKGTHFMECPPCAIHTPELNTLQEALAAWEAMAISANPAAAAA